MTKKVRNEQKKTLQKLLSNTQELVPQTFPVSFFFH